MMKKFLFLAIFCLLWTPFGFAHHGGGGTPGISFLTSEALSKKQLSVVFLPAFEKRRDSDKTLFSVGFESNMSKEWFFFGRTEVYDIHRFVDEDEQKCTHGYGDTDLTVIYRFNEKKVDSWAQSFLINFHIPTGNIKKHLTHGFIKYEPTLILTYKKQLPRQTTLEFFTQNGFILLQRIQKDEHEEDDLDLDAPEDHDEPEDIQDEHEQGHSHINNHHHDDDKEPTAYSFVWNSGFAMINENSTCSLEFDWENNKWNYGRKNNLYLTPRSFFTVTKNILIGLSVPVGLTQSADRFKLIGYIQIGIDSLIYSQDKSKINSSFLQTRALLN